MQALRNLPSYNLHILVSADTNNVNSKVSRKYLNVSRTKKKLLLHSVDVSQSSQYLAFVFGIYSSDISRFTIGKSVWRQRSGYSVTSSGVDEMFG